MNIFSALLIIFLLSPSFINTSELQEFNEDEFEELYEDETQEFFTILGKKAGQLSNKIGITDCPIHVDNENKSEIIDFVQGFYDGLIVEPKPYTSADDFLTNDIKPLIDQTNQCALQPQVDKLALGYINDICSAILIKAHGQYLEDKKKYD